MASVTIFFSNADKEYTSLEFGASLQTYPELLFRKNFCRFSCPGTKSPEPRPRLSSCAEDVRKMVRLWLSIQPQVDLHIVFVRHNNSLCTNSNLATVRSDIRWYLEALISSEGEKVGSQLQRRRKILNRFKSTIEHPTISPKVFNHYDEGSRGIQPDNLTRPSRGNPPTTFSMLFHWVTK